MLDEWGAYKHLVALAYLIDALMQIHYRPG